jgi:hypothetical protein
MNGSLQVKPYQTPEDVSQNSQLMIPVRRENPAVSFLQDENFLWSNAVLRIQHQLLVGRVSTKTAFYK